MIDALLSLAPIAGAFVSGAYAAGVAIFARAIRDQDEIRVRDRISNALLWPLFWRGL